MNDIFKALADPHRRQLLDTLYQKDGQTSRELETALRAAMGRFGVMKHLKILEQASLITTCKLGRFKYHYLNPVPIQEIADRWISRFSQPWIQGLTNIKTVLEKENIMVAKPKHVYVTMIKTTPEKLWAALTDPKLTVQYFFAHRLQSTLKTGADFNYLDTDNKIMLRGKVIEATQPKKLVTTFTACWDPVQAKEPPSQVTYEIEQQGNCCKLTLTHDHFDGETATFKSVGDGWPIILSGLKTLLETGKPLAYKENVH